MHVLNMSKVLHSGVGVYRLNLCESKVQSVDCSKCEQRAGLNYLKENNHKVFLLN